MPPEPIDVKMSSATAGSRIIYCTKEYILVMKELDRRYMVGILGRERYSQALQVAHARYKGQIDSLCKLIVEREFVVPEDAV